VTEQPGAAPPDNADARDVGGLAELGTVGSTVGSTVGTMFGRDGLYMVASSLQLLSGVLVTPIVTRVLGLHQYGIFAADLALLYVLYYTANLGLNIGIQRLYSQPDGDRRSRNLLATSVVVVAAVTAVVYATGPLWAPHLGFGPFPLSTRLTVVWSGLFALTWIWLAILRCNERLSVFATVCLLQSIVGIGLGAIVAFLGSGLTTEVLWCAVVVQAVALLLAMWTIRPHWRGIVDFATTRSTLWFALPVLPLQLSTFTMSAADRIVILRDLGPAATGRYQVAYTVSAVGISMLTFLNLAWLPRIFAITDRATRAEVLAHSRDGLYQLLVPVTLAIALGAPVVLPIWAPSSFRAESLLPVIVLVVASTFPVCTAFVHSRLLLSEGRSASVAGVTVTAAVVNVVLNLVFVPHIGINGSALATLIAYTLLALGMAAVGRLLLPLPRPPIRLWVRVALAIAAILCSRFLPVSAAWDVARLAVCAACLAWALAILRDLRVSRPNRVRRR
jgi:O-antigen/teichoic acid export membrane protein